MHHESDTGREKEYLELPDGGDACWSMHHESDSLSMRGKGLCRIAGWRGCRDACSRLQHGATALEGRADMELLDGGDACSSMHHWSDSTRGKGRCGIAGWRGCMLQHASLE
jgi:hypothetical protein